MFRTEPGARPDGLLGKLPIEVSRPHSARASSGASPRRRQGAIVLVVEDDVDRAELVQRALERQRFRVTVVGDSAVCFQAVADHRDSLILLDDSLPRRTGLEVLTELRARCAGA